MAFGDKPDSQGQGTQGQMDPNTVGMLQAALAISAANKKGARFSDLALNGLAGYAQGVGATQRYGQEQEAMKQRQLVQQMQYESAMAKAAREKTQDQSAEAFVSGLSPEEQATARAIGPEQYMRLKAQKEENEALMRYRHDSLAQSAAQHNASLALQRERAGADKGQYDPRLGGFVHPDGRFVPVVGPDGQPLAARGEGQPAKFEDVNTVGKRFKEDSKTFQDMSGSLARVVSAGQRDDAPSEMGMVFSFMKMLDPGSTVREGEYAKAEDARGVPASVLNTYNKVVKGTRLTPEQKEQFVGYARGLWENERAQHEIRTQYYNGLAKQYNMPAEQVIQDFTSVPEKSLQEYDAFKASKKNRGSSLSGGGQNDFQGRPPLSSFSLNR